MKNQKEIIEHIETYARTKKIHQALAPYYDQDGLWLGGIITRSKRVDKQLLAIIQKSALPANQRFSIHRKKIIQHTSWRVSRKGQHLIQATEIRGNLTANRTWDLSAKNLRSLGGNFYGSTLSRFDLPKLKEVGGDFIATCRTSDNAASLRIVCGNMTILGEIPPKLQFVGKTLSLLFSPRIFAPELKHVDGSLMLYKTLSADLPVLETIGQGFFLKPQAAQSINAPMLRSIGEDFSAINVKTIEAPRLRWVGGMMDTRSEPYYYHPDIRVGGEWICHPHAIHYWAYRQKMKRMLLGSRFDYEV
jgi:hypothetical protein